MAKINLNNYEKYALDYIEGNLDAKTKADFEVFLQIYPEIAEELRDLQDINLKKDNNIVFENKHFLKQSEVEDISYIDYLVISDIEGVATDEEKQNLKVLMVQNNEVAKLYEDYRKTILPPHNIVFDDKESLKKKPVKVYFTTFLRYAVAASVILFVGMFLLNRQNGIEHINTDIIAVSVSKFSFQQVKYVGYKCENLDYNLDFHRKRNTKNDQKISQKSNLSQNQLVCRNDVQIDTNVYETTTQVVIADLPQKKNIKILETLPRPEFRDVAVSYGEMYVERNFVQPTEVVNKILDVYEIATENQHLNMNICYDKKEKTLCFAVKNKDYVVVF